MADTILFVDDDPEVRAKVSQLLKENGYRVISASDGDEALDKARETSPDLIILDIMMPRLDGILTILKLKGKGETKSIPVIILSIIDKSDEEVLAKHLGVRAFIRKPYEDCDLLAKVREGLQGTS